MHLVSLLIRTNPIPSMLLPYTEVTGFFILMRPALWIYVSIKLYVDRGIFPVDQAGYTVTSTLGGKDLDKIPMLLSFLRSQQESLLF